MKRAVLVAITGAILLQLHQGPAVISALAPDGLTFFKNYFLTGDYVVGGVGLRGKGVYGLATGSITIDQVPAGADIVAAFLYWQVVSKSTLGPDSGSAGATFRDIPLSTPAGPFAKVLGQAGTAPCWSSGGSTGAASGKHRTYTYRTDVLRFFAADEQTGKLRVNGTHRVQVPDSGPYGNSVPIALGASLVVVYRDPALPLNAIVMYDGGFTVDNSNRTMFQTIRGFYQPAPSPQAKITYIVGSGQANKNENVLVNGSPFLSNPFGGFDGASWDTVTRPVSLGTQPQDVRSVTTSVETKGVKGDCLSVGAIMFKTAVIDSDGDGLLDEWESSPTPIADPNGQPLPLLGAMGADPRRKDLFLEIGYTKTAVDALYGGVSKPAHSHLPAHETLKLVGDAFKNAPVANPDGTTGIRVHFDVGADYPGGDPLDPAKNAGEYIVPADLARGGEAIDEMKTVCTRTAADPPWVCQYSEYPGTVGWKTGFRFLRDEIVGSEPPPLPGETDRCDTPGNDGPGQPCERRFDRNRKDIFHYALFAHATGLPKSEEPCLDLDGLPVAHVNGLCAVAENPEFRVPQTITGVGDFPGGDILVTLGAFPDVNALPIGTPFMQASTLMHELGHNLERRHGGEAFELNCKPTYLSAMNYLYQLRGLLDDSGKPHLDFSRAAIDSGGGPLNETSLFDGSLSLLPFRIGWYAPLAGSYLEGRAEAAKKHCDGSPLLESDAPMVRIDARTAAGGIDWNANSISTDAGFTQDINFNGRTRRTDDSIELLRGSDDWFNIRLNQVGARRNVGGLFLDSLGRLTVGPLSLDAGRGDFGRGDFGRGDFGRGDFGGGDLFQGDPDNPGGELDFETATDLAKTPPTEFVACVIGTTGCPGAETHNVRLTWKTPTVGGATSYIAYRVTGAELVPGQVWTQVGSGVDAVAGQVDYSLLDRTLLQNGQPYTYFTIAFYSEGTQSDPSNLVTILAINDAPTGSSIPDQSISVNSSTGPLSFTIGDEDPASVTVSGTSSNQVLVPNGNIVFGGSGATRTVTVTPAANQTGATTITVTLTDGTGGVGIAPITFLLTVKAVAYDFIGFLTPLATAGTEAEPSKSGTFTLGKAIPIKWKLVLGGTFVSDLASLRELVAVPGNALYNAGCVPNGAAPLRLLDPATGRPTGYSTYRYDAAKKQFIFNWDTSAASKSKCYRLTLTLNDGSSAKVTIVRFK